MSHQKQTDQDNHTFVIFGDIHENITKLQDIVELPHASGVIITGDLTNVGNKQQASFVIDAVKHYNSNIFAQIGNMDLPEVTDFLTADGYNIHRAVRPLLGDSLPDIGIMGLGGSPFTPFKTPSEFSESDLAAWIERMFVEACHFKRLIFVSHAPPLDSACDIIPSGVHVGSSAVKAFILKHQPDICLCGHIHEASAIDTIGRTQIMNTGTLLDGGYGLLHVNADSIKLTRHTWA